MRWVFRLIGAVVVLAVLAIGAVALIPAEKIAALALARLETLTGRKVTLEGSVRPSLWPVLGVQTGPVTISNADWSDAGPMFRAETRGLLVLRAELRRFADQAPEFWTVAPLIDQLIRDGRKLSDFGA